MRIRTLFLLCMCAVAALATALGTWMLLQMLWEYTIAGRVERAVEIDTLIFVASDQISRERPVTGNALLDEEPPDQATRDRIMSARQQADAAIQQVVRHIQVRPYAGAAAKLAVIDQISADLATWRASVDAALSRPKSQRDPTLFGRYLSHANGIFRKTSSALDVGDMPATLHDGTTVELISLSRYIWDIRTAMGLRTAPLMTALDAGARFDAAMIVEQGRVDGILEATWGPIESLTVRLSEFPDLAAAVARARAIFDTYDEVSHSVIAAGSGTDPYPISALAYGRYPTRVAPVLLHVRDLALDAARRRVVHSREKAGLYVIIGAMVLALTILAMVIVLMVLQRRIVFPVLAFTEAIGRIARLDFDVVIPARKRMDEIGHMAVALDALRQGAMAGEASKAQIVHMARHDALTGLPNRLMLHDCLDHAIAMAGRGQVAAALCLDLDRFKAVNDTFGHPMGDLLLKAVATRLSACVREIDTVSRLGGDEFVVLLVGLEQPDHAAIAAQRIARALSDPFILDGQTVSIGSSIGIAITPQDASSGVALLKCADTALYRAKAEEKGGWRYFRPDMDTYLQERMLLERDLREAVRNEAFELAYQPQYSLLTGRIIGVEALLRWRHPTRGMVAPATFIPIAEETGLIVPIGSWVLRQACQEAANWPPDVRLAVNLSGVQFRKRDLLATVRRSLVAAGLPANRLELEITETVLLSNNETNLVTLHELHDMGISIAMDDFGTGYSSLVYLRSFPFNTVKIDQSFIRDLSDHEDSRAIVRAIVALANALGMTTIGEGVETAAQLAELRSQGCDHVQGYFFSKPVAPEAVLGLIAAGASPASENPPPSTMRVL